jgi:hypothetical protein
MPHVFISYARDFAGRLFLRADITRGRPIPSAEFAAYEEPVVSSRRA